jgi:hypothetical protein
VTGNREPVENRRSATDQRYDGALASGGHAVLAVLGHGEVLRTQQTLDELEGSADSIWD